MSDLSAFAADVHRVAAGNVVIDQELVSRLVSRRRERDPLAEPTDRERHVLALMAQGPTNAGLSDELFVSAKTVEGYIRNVFTKRHGHRATLRGIPVLRNCGIRKAHRTIERVARPAADIRRHESWSAS